MSVLTTRNIEVKEYTEDLHTFWDQFIRTSSRNGGIFQERDFLSYHPKEKFNDASLLFFEEGDLIGVFPAAIIIDDGKKKVISHPGSSCVNARLSDILCNHTAGTYYYIIANTHR